MRNFRILVLIVCTFAAEAVQAQTDTINGIINGYIQVMSYSDCDHCVEGDTTGSGLEEGDRVVIMQMKGCRFDTSNTIRYGTSTKMSASGLFEFATIASITASEGHYSICFANATINNYDAGSHPARAAVQLVRVPQYEKAVVTNPGGSSPLTAAAWEGVLGKGGVLAFEVSDTLWLLADIRVDGKGFAGGGHSLNSDSVNLYGYVFDKSTKSGGFKGEGIGFENRYPGIEDPNVIGRGPSVNGGGGGNGMNAGGGGGGNAGAGGKGGKQLSSVAIIENGGLGGRGYNYSGGPLRRIFMGGGGGGGHQNNDGDGGTTNGGEGGRGGGIIIIRAGTIIGNGHTMSSNGDAGESVTDDGAGGGGAGGVILLYYTSLNAGGLDTSLIVEAKGNAGGNATGGASECHGPGGGGGGGVIWLKSGSTPSSVMTKVSGGTPGTAVSCTDPDTDASHGAAAGAAGVVAYNLALPGDALP